MVLEFDNFCMRIKTRTRKRVVYKWFFKIYFIANTDISLVITKNKETNKQTKKKEKENKKQINKQAVITKKKSQYTRNDI